MAHSAGGFVGCAGTRRCALQQGVGISRYVEGPVHTMYSQRLTENRLPERMLSMRILHFAKNQIFWDCATTSSCEALPSGIPQPLDGVAGLDRHWRGRLQVSESLRQRPLAGEVDDSLEAFWKSAVRKYTSCDLTKGSDKLTALWGIAKLVRDALEEEYAAGLWEKNLDEQLAWRVAKCSLDERPIELRDNPSWSWASISGTIEVQDRIPEELRQYVVKDHDGNPISFRLMRKRHPTLGGKQSDTWKEVIATMGRSLEQAEDKHKPGPNKSKRVENTVAGQIQSTSSTNNPRDRQPEFQDKSIAIQTHIGHSRLWYDKLKRKWRLKISSADGMVLEDAIFQVFPDVKPKSEGTKDIDCHFIVLASSQVRQHGETTAQGEVTYSGVGITLKPTGKNYHFYRTGALHFRDISVEALNCLQATYRKESDSQDQWDKVKGLKFWLD